MPTPSDAPALAGAGPALPAALDAALRRAADDYRRRMLAPPGSLASMSKPDAARALLAVDLRDEQWIADADALLRRLVGDDPTPAALPAPRRGVGAGRGEA